MIDISFYSYKPLSWIALLISDENQMKHLDSLSLSEALHYDWAGKDSENAGNFGKSGLQRFISGIGYDIHEKYLEAGHKFGHAGKICRRLGAFSLADKIKESFEIPCYLDAGRDDLASRESSFLKHNQRSDPHDWNELIPSAEEQAAHAKSSSNEYVNDLDYITVRLSNSVTGAEGQPANFLSYIGKRLDTTREALPAKGNYDQMAPEELIETAQEAMDQRLYDKAYEMLKAASRLADPEDSKLHERIEHNRRYVIQADLKIKYWAGLEQHGVELRQPQVHTFSSRLEDINTVACKPVNTSQMSADELDRWAAKRATLLNEQCEQDTTFLSRYRNHHAQLQEAVANAANY